MEGTFLQSLILPAPVASGWTKLPTPESDEVMVLQPNSKCQRRVFYGWITLLGDVLLIFMMGGVFINCFGVFLPVISDDFGWSRGTVAFALSLSIMCFGIPSPFFGTIIARFGARRALIIGNTIAALGLAALFFVNEVWQFYTLYAIVGLAAGYGGYVAGTTLVANWFVKKRPLALGIYAASGGLGGFVFPPIATALIEAVGWRMSWVILAGAILVIGVILGGLVLVRNKPEDMGLQPDGEDPTPVTEVAAGSTAAPAGETSYGSSMKKLLKHPVIWVISGFSFANAYALGTMLSHQIAYIKDVGYTAMTAATTMSVLSAAVCIGSIIFGTLAMKAKLRTLVLGAFGVELIAMILLLLTRQIQLIYVYALLIGLGNGALATAQPTFAGKYFHGKDYAPAIGITMPFQVVAQSIGAAVAGWVYDTTGQYTIAFVVVSSFIILGMVFVAVSRPPTYSQSS